MKPENLLPAAISSITPQKNNKNRYSIFVDNAFLMGIADTTLLKHGLKKGIEVTPSLFKKLQRDEGYNKVKNYMLRLLGRREHARQELSQKAERKEFSPEMIDLVLGELAEKDFINDTRFAQKYANDKNHLNKWGPNKVSAHLLKKGVAKSITESAISATFKSTDMEERLRKLVLKRKKHFLREVNELKRKQKIVNYLLQKGYKSQTVFKYVDSILQYLNQK